MVSPRVRIGTGRPEIPGFEAGDWVLGRFPDEERGIVNDAVIREK
jgi:hypothetical protein